jgi:hypothetical protein
MNIRAAIIPLYAQTGKYAATTIILHASFLYENQEKFKHLKVMPSRLLITKNPEIPLALIQSIYLFLC